MANYLIWSNIQKEVSFSINVQFRKDPVLQSGLLVFLSLTYIFFDENLLCISFILLSSLAYSQNQKGEMLLSVAVSPYPTTTNGENDFGAIGLATFEFFVSEKVSLSGSFFTTNNTLIKDNSGITIHSYGFIPCIHYYFVNKKKWNLFAQIGYGFGFEDQTQGYIQNSALIVYNIGPGTHYKIGEKLYLKLFVPYFNARNITLNVRAARGITPFVGLGFKF